MRKAIVFVLAASVCLWSQATWAAGKYPQKPITMIIPWDAGGGTDLVHRAASKSAEEHLKQPIVIVNKPGAGGVIGSKMVENADPDGYTLGGITSTVLVTQYTAPNPTDWSKYEPVFTVTYDPGAIAVRKDSQWKSLKELIAYAKANPKKVKVGNAGIGALHHLFAVGLETEAGVEFHHIPYKGAGAAKVALLGNEVDAVSADTGAFYAQVVSGQLRLLGIAADQRFSGFPDTPTYKEQGVPLTIGMWRLVAAPKGTPKEVIKILVDAYSKAMKSQEIQKKQGQWILVGRGAEETGAVMKRDDQMWKRIAQKYLLQKK
ncbi:MAG: tripartite tricarboxylate transporter substrate binding protein [Deltaproteobacteria bacterium]|nr:tripartite tricarboxylate transporter substrate binding protein [Deltaproteobacteria bacterium]